PFSTAVPVSHTLSLHAALPISAPSVRQGADSLKKGSPYRFIAESGLEASTTHVGLLGHVDLNTWITMSIQRAIDNVHSRTQDGLDRKSTRLNYSHQIISYVVFC